MAQGDDAMEAKTLNASASSFTFKASAASFVPTKAAAAEPFYPQQPYKSDPKYQEGGYYDGATESQPEELPKRKSFADLGLDSLGFVSDEDGDEDAGQDPASPLSKQRRQAVVQQLESGMSGQHPQHEDYHHQQYPDNGEYYDEGAYHHGGYHPAAHYPSQTYGAGYDGAHYHQHAKAYAHRHQHDREYGVVADGEWSGAGWEGAHGRGEMNELDEREFLMLLQESFQGYSLESLEELLVANGGDISLTVEILTELDVEVKPPEPPALDDESNFPTLGGGGGGSGSGGGGEETREPPEEIFRSFTISGGMSNVRAAPPPRPPRRATWTRTVTNSRTGSGHARRFLRPSSAPVCGWDTEPGTSQEGASRRVSSGSKRETQFPISTRRRGRTRGITCGFVVCAFSRRRRRICPGIRRSLRS